MVAQPGGEEYSWKELNAWFDKLTLVSDTEAGTVRVAEAVYARAEQLQDSS